MAVPATRAFKGALHFHLVCVFQVIGLKSHTCLFADMSGCFCDGDLVMLLYFFPKAPAVLQFQPHALWATSW